MEGRMSRLLDVVFTLLLAALVAPIVQSQQPATSHSLARSYFSDAQRSLAAGDSAAAIGKLNHAVQADPTFADAYLLLGITEFKRGNTAAAMQYDLQALKLQPHSYSAHYNLALAYLREHRFNEGRAQLEQAVRLDPNQPDAAYDLGIVLLEHGHPAEAMVHLTRAQKLNPQRPDVAFNIVRACLESGHALQARTEAQAAAHRFGSDPQWSAAIGQLFLKNAQPEDAALYLRVASRIRPDDTGIRHQLALAYLAADQPKQALALIPDPKTSDDHYLRGSAFYMDHRFEDADQESDAALTLAPDNPQALALRIRLLQRAGQQNAAVELARKTESLTPDWYEPYYLDGISLYFLGRFPEAGQRLARAVELNPSSARALFMAAVTQVSLGKADQAEVLLRRAITLQPRNARFHCHLGILLARRNRDAEAQASFRKAVKLSPKYALSHYELGKLLAESNRLREAAGELNQSISYQPGLSAAYYQLARVYSRLGEVEKSKRVLAEFEKLHQREMSDSQALDEDARKETQ